ncbi:MAG: tRNA guanosine(34) transglycosylase Tgt, partial [Candidatus Levybacteria bacterium]|nr:tRNA guanosine(34) transglycosylase Tgt [Candidatus Levybacteria bacterium]
MKSQFFNFKIIKKDKKSAARVGQITTSHGVINTPCFIPVGTKATVKGLTPGDLKEIGVQILFGNTYHLHLRPGEETVQKFGGIGKFMSWNGPTITDSGGFQVFSLGRDSGRLTHAVRPARQAFFEKSLSNSRSLSEIRQPSVSLLNGNSESDFSCLTDGKSPFAPEEKPRLVKITEDGVKFRSHIDGSLHVFTPEESIKIQQKLGADIILAFDECAPHTSTYEYTKKALARTHKWALRSLKAAQGKLANNEQALFGIIQGGVFKDLREESAKFIGSLPFDGIAIGGVSVGESKKQMRDVLDWVVPYLPDDKPRHLLGIGEIDDIFEAVERGIDTFDCVIPTRFGRYGIVFVESAEEEEKNRFRIDITRSIFSKDKRPIAKDCKCMVCRDFSRAYIHHLFRSNELLAYRLASYHNLYFIIKLVDKIR